MTIKLISSQNYLDNLKSFLPEKPNSEISANKIYNKLINSPNFIFDKNDHRITDHIKTLVSIRPGRTLFKRLLNANKPLEIVYDSEAYSRLLCTKEITVTNLTLNDSTVSHQISVNSDGEKFFIPGAGFIILAHELIHALHYFEEGIDAVEQKRKNKNLLDPELHNLEEEETIMGKEGEGTLCENLFRFRFGYPLRINHQGLSLDKDKTYTVSDCASSGALANLKTLLVSDPSLLNLPQRYGNTDSLLMTPLNAAITDNQVEISDYLFQLGVDVNAYDKHWGTALHVAIQNEQIDMVKTLLSKGANVDVKDPFGRSALELVLNKKNDELLELLAPHLNLKEVDKYGNPLLHRVFKECSLKGFRTLIRHGADINCKTSYYNTTFLMECCDKDYRSNDLKEEADRKFEILLENDHLDLNAKDRNGMSALSMAVQKGNCQWVNALVNKGAEIPPSLEVKVKKLIQMNNT